MRHQDQRSDLKDSVAYEQGSRGAQKRRRISRMAEALGLRFVPFCVLESKVKQAIPIIQRLVAA